MHSAHAYYDLHWNPAFDRSLCESIRKIVKDILNTKKARGRKARYVTFAHIPGSVWRPVRLFSNCAVEGTIKLWIAVTRPVVFAVCK